MIHIVKLERKWKLEKQKVELLTKYLYDLLLNDCQNKSNVYNFAVHGNFFHGNSVHKICPCVLAYRQVQISLSFKKLASRREQKNCRLTYISNSLSKHYIVEWNRNDTSKCSYSNPWLHGHFVKNCCFHWKVSRYKFKLL
jgi:hypothetical protein